MGLLVPHADVWWWMMVPSSVPIGRRLYYPCSLHTSLGLRELCESDFVSQWNQKMMKRLLPSLYFEGNPRCSLTQSLCLAWQETWALDQTAFYFEQKRARGRLIDLGVLSALGSGTWSFKKGNGEAELERLITYTLRWMDMDVLELGLRLANNGEKPSHSAWGGGTWSLHASEGGGLAMLGHLLPCLGSAWRKHGLTLISSGRCCIR